jgi:hypothetical protein
MKQAGTFAFDATEKVLDIGSDFAGFGSVLVYPDTQVQISLNDNSNYVTYDAMDKTIIGGWPQTIQKLYVKGTGTGNLRFWAYK